MVKAFFCRVLPAVCPDWSQMDGLQQNTPAAAPVEAVNSVSLSSSRADEDPSGRLIRTPWRKLEVTWPKMDPAARFFTSSWGWIPDKQKRW